MTKYLPLICVLQTAIIICAIVFIIVLSKKTKTESTEQPSKDCWDRLKIIAEVVAILAVIYYGHIVSTAIKERELNLQYIQVATEILKVEPTEEIADLRDWSINLLEKYSIEVLPFGEDAAHNQKHFSRPSARPRLNDVPDPDGIPDPDWVP